MLLGQRSWNPEALPSSTHYSHALALGGGISWQPWGENAHTGSLRKVWGSGFITSAHMPLARTWLVNLMPHLDLCGQRKHIYTVA